jgi:hypothetical protein
MAMATPTDITRRTLAATLAALPAAAIAGPITAATVGNPDAELFELFRQWAAAVEEATAASLVDDLPDEEANRIFGHEAGLQVAIVQRPAHTLAGLWLKAQVALRAAEFNTPSEHRQALLDHATETDGPASPVPAALAVVLDLLAMEGKAA